MAVQHAKWLEEALKLAWRAPVAVAQHPAHLDLLAQRPQRLQPPGPGPHRHDPHQAGHGRPHLPAARRQLPALGGRPLPPQPRLREPHRHRQAAAAPVPRPRRGRPRTAQRGASVWEWAEQRRRRRARRRAGLRRATSRPWRRWPRRWLLRTARARPAGPGRERGRPHDAVPARATTRTAWTSGAFVDLFTARPPRGVRLPRLPAGDAPAHPRARRTPSASTCAASASRAPPPRRSTWWCSTG